MPELLEENPRKNELDEKIGAYILTKSETSIVLKGVSHIGKGTTESQLAFIRIAYVNRLKQD